MSASPLSKQMSESRTIPTKRIFINDPSDLPSIYSSTPGGTLYSTTPGGTKIVYDKSFLMNLRNSPISKTPPTFGIPESLMRGNNNNNNNNNACSPNKRSVKNNIPSPKRNLPKPCPPKFEEEEQFQLDL